MSNEKINEAQVNETTSQEIMLLQEQISALQAELESEKESRTSAYNWYKKERDKVRALTLIIKSMDCSMTIDSIVERIANML